MEGPGGEAQGVADPKKIAIFAGPRVLSFANT
jgi:hypothetical protein